MSSRKRPSKPLTPVDDISDARGFQSLINAHLSDLRVKNYSEQTVVGREQYLRRFAVWCLDRGLGRPTEITKPVLERFQRHLFNYRTEKDGKGKKDRVIPIGQRALNWITVYLESARNKLLVDPNERTLFITNAGEPLEPDSLTEYVRRYIDASGIGKKGSCHVFRHTVATLMLENGADIRFIQAMLGHVKLTTTEIYTQVSIRKLQQIHDLTHPGNRPEEHGNEPPQPPQDKPNEPEEPQSGSGA